MVVSIDSFWAMKELGLGPVGLKAPNCNADERERERLIQTFNIW